MGLFVLMMAFFHHPILSFKCIHEWWSLFTRSEGLFFKDLCFCFSGGLLQPHQPPVRYSLWELHRTGLPNNEWGAQVSFLSCCFCVCVTGQLFSDWSVFCIAVWPSIWLWEGYVIDGSVLSTEHLFFPHKLSFVSVWPPWGTVLMVEVQPSGGWNAQWFKLFTQHHVTWLWLFFVLFLTHH